MSPLFTSHFFLLMEDMKSLYRSDSLGARPVRRGGRPAGVDGRAEGRDLRPPRDGDCAPPGRLACSDKLGTRPSSSMLGKVGNLHVEKCTPGVVA